MIGVGTHPGYNGIGALNGNNLVLHTEMVGYYDNVTPPAAMKQLAREFRQALNSAIPGIPIKYVGDQTWNTNSPPLGDTGHTLIPGNAKTCPGTKVNVREWVSSSSGLLEASSGNYEPEVRPHAPGPAKRVPVVAEDTV